MFKKNDPNSYSKYCTLMSGTDEKEDIIGTIFCEYQVNNYDDVQLKDIDAVAKNKNRTYLVQCTQRIIIYNKDGMNVSPNNNLTSYEFYPAMLNTSMFIKTENINYELLEYSPQTVNTKIQSSGTSGNTTGQTSGTSKSDTVGSSTSQTNSYGTSVSMGFQGDMAMGSASASYENSETNTQEQSHTTGSESSSSKSSEISSSASMSLKDWGAYSLINPETKSPSWNFGQEYPWDVIECRKTNGNSYPNQDSKYNNLTEIVIPSEMLARLYDGVSLYPPSQLSMFGINFVMKSAWLVTLDDGNTSDLIEIEHEIMYFRGAHCLNTGNQVSVYLEKTPIILQVKSGESLTTNINLPLMALDVLGSPNKQAIIGFIPNKFMVAPSPMSSGVHTAFKIISTSNTLYIKDTTDYSNVKDNGAGFSASETCLTANFSQQCTSLSFTVYFKITDTINDYNLYLKHWKKQGSKGIKLTFTINKDTDNAIVKFIDAEEAEGAEKNLLAIALRDQNYASIDYHDYLQLGLNSIEVKIEPIDGQYSDNCGYQIRAISIEGV